MTFLVLLFAYVFSQFFRSFLAVVSGELVRDLGLDAAGLGTLSAVWFGTFAIAQFPVGYALDRVGPRLTLSVGMGVAVAGSAGLALSRDYLEAVAAMGLIGIGCAPVLMAGMYYFARTAPRERFAVLSATLIGLAALGNLLGSAPLALAAARFGWRAALGAISAATALAAVSCWLALRDPPPLAGGRDRLSFLGGLRAVLSIRALWLILPMAGVSYAAVIAIRSLWIAPFLSAATTLDAVQVGYAAAAMAAAMVLGSIAFGPLERWIGPKGATVLGVATTAVALMALGTWQSVGWGAAIVLLVTVGLFGMTYAVLMTHVRLFLPDDLIGRGVTLANVAFIGGAGIVQWVSGQMVATALAAGGDPAATYRGLFLAYGAGLTAVLALYVFSPARPPTLTRPAPAP